MPAGRPWEYFNPQYADSMRRMVAGPVGIPPRLQMAQRAPREEGGGVSEWGPAVAGVGSALGAALSPVPGLGPAVAGISTLVPAIASAVEEKDPARAIGAAGRTVGSMAAAMEQRDREARLRQAMAAGQPLPGVPAVNMGTPWYLR